jgi:hypothetical protein
MCLIVFIVYMSVMNRKMQNKMKMIYFGSVKKNLYFEKGGGAPKDIISTRTCESELLKRNYFYVERNHVL